MPYTAIHKYARISPRKVRALANLVRGKFADEALDILRFEHKQAPGLDDLVVVDARIDPGPMFKRIRPRARGMAFGIKRRMSHIKVALDSKVVEAGE